MAAFFKYICRFENCQKKFSTLFDLIDHIEYNHIIRDPTVLKQQELSQPPAIALSYVNCFFSEHFRKERPGVDITHVGLKKYADPDKKLYSKNDSLNDSFDSLLDDDTFSDAGSDDSCQSWATSVSSNTGLNHHDHTSSLIPPVSNYTHTPATITTESLQGKFTCLEDSEGKKKFLCTVPGCTKKYKNINGIKYHVKNGHTKKDSISGEIKKNYLCHCGKAYKSQSGLRHHQNTQHGLSANSGNKVSSYTPIHYDVRMDNNFKQPQVKQMISLPPVEEMYQPQTPLSPSGIVT